MVINWSLKEKSANKTLYKYIIPYVKLVREGGGGVFEKYILEWLPILNISHYLIQLFKLFLLIIVRVHFFPVVSHLMF